MDEIERKNLRNRCKQLPGHVRTTPAEAFEQLASWSREHGPEFDFYGTGSLIEEFEAKVSRLLGYPAARFLPTGKLAQGIALRMWSDRAGSRHIGMHPSSHLELHESRGYSHLFELRATLVGPYHRPLLAEHLSAVPEQLAALLTELPIREAGGQLPSWDQLEELKVCARGRGTALHLDGARLWECKSFYGREYAEICAGFDSCYVSFYKGIGGLAGSMLLGPEDFIAEAAVWQQRAGGTVFTLAPYVASAAMQLDERLAKMPAYFEKALELAGVLRELDGIRLLPDPPHVNMMHVYLDVLAERANDARDALAVERGEWLFHRAVDADVPGYSRFEFYVGDNALEWTATQLGDSFARLLEIARSEAS